MTDENAKLRVENEKLRKTKNAEVDKVKHFLEVEMAEAIRLLDAEVEKVVSLKFFSIDCIIFNLSWFEFWSFYLLFQVKANLEAQGLRDDLKVMAEKLRFLTISAGESRKLAEDLQAEIDQLRAEAATNRRQFQNFQEEKVCTLFSVWTKISFLI